MGGEGKKFKTTEVINASCALHNPFLSLNLGHNELVFSLEMMLNWIFKK